MKKPQSGAKKSKTKGNQANEYASIVLKGVEYSIGCVAYVKEANDEECLATIETIIQTTETFPQARIRWFYKPSDVFPEPNACFSEREYFDSDHKQLISAECLDGVARMISFDEFFLCDCIDSDLYFTRAKYNPSTQTLVPPLEIWPLVCECKEIANPDESFKKCIGCGGSFHEECIQNTCPKCTSSDLLIYNYTVMEERA